jgi:hypothetical protein
VPDGRLVRRDLEHEARLVLVGRALGLLLEAVEEVDVRRHRVLEAHESPYCRDAGRCDIPVAWDAWKSARSCFVMSAATVRKNLSAIAAWTRSHRPRESQPLNE